MDALDEFSIEFDITDREHVYDYVTCTKYDRPDSGWDYSIFKSSHSGLDLLDDDDENGQFRVKLMDKAFNDSKVFEKYNKQERDEDKAAKAARKDDQSHYVWLEGDKDKKNRLPRRVIPIYKPGDVIKGTVLLAVNKAVDAQNINVGFQGRSYVSVRIYHARGYFDSTGEEIFVKEKKHVWEKVKDGVDDEFSLLNFGPGQIARSTVIPPGQHKFPFEYAIPSSMPQSAPPMVISSADKGYIMYRIKAVIAQEHVGGRGNLVVHRGLWVQKDVDIAQDPHNMEPIEAEETHETGIIKKGKINIRATMDHSGVILGEKIPVRIDVTNQSGGDIDKVSAYIRMHGKARVSDKKLAVSNSINIKGEKCKESVPAGQSLSFNWNLAWDFSNCSVDGNMLPVGDLDDSKLLDVKYEVKIDVKRKGLHRNMHLAIPLFVGNINSRA